MAAGFNELELPAFSIAELFIPQKLMPTSTNPQTQPMPTVSASPMLPQTIGEEVPQKTFTSIVQQEFDALPFASVDRLEMSPPKERPVPLSYSSAVQAPKRSATPELDSNGSTVSSDFEDSLPMRRPSLFNARSRRIDPNRVSQILLNFTRNTFYIYFA